MEGILLIDKPTRISSFDVIRQLRRRFRELEWGKVKMGHAGTLDPAASGLLVVALGKATKTLPSLIGADKSYEAGVLLGQKTDTLDVEGSVIEEKDVSSLTEEMIKQAGQSLLGCHEFAVPLYSAIKVDGKPLYAYARAGKTPPRIPVKTMCVHELVVQRIEKQQARQLVTIAVSVTKGTYIRTLAEQFGNQLEAPAMLTSLRRTKVGQFDVKDAVFVDDVTEQSIRPV